MLEMFENSDKNGELIVRTWWFCFKGTVYTPN